MPNNNKCGTKQELVLSGAYNNGNQYHRWI